jgi:hypothetical protein
MIDASSLDSLLFDCVNHSKYSEDLKQRLRDKISKSENLKLEYKNTVLKYRHLKKHYDGNIDGDEDGVYDDASDCDLDDTYFNDIVGDINISIEKLIRPPTEYNIFIMKTMHKLKANNPNLTNNDLFRSCVKLWQKIKKQPEVSKLLFKNVLNDINNIGITNDMCKVTNLVIKNKTDHCVNYK